MSKEKFLTLLQSKYVLPFTFGFIGLLLIIFGLTSFFFTDKNSHGVLIEEAASTENTASASSSHHIVVDVSGALEKPGVYELFEGARIQDALIAAGGLAEDADREYISKGINLAAKVSDGGKIYIPRVGERITVNADVLGRGVAGGVPAVININTASQSDLETLSGIGPVTAEKIIASRPYGSTDELVKKNVLGSKAFEKIKDKISIY